MNLKFLPIAAAAVSASAAMASPTTLNFDSFAAGPASGGSAPLVTNGYGGLNWNNFEVIDGADSPHSGYQPATVSGNNVAFNGRGNPAMISSSAFDLTSGYFTAAWNDGLQLEVQGFVGTTLTFDNVYTLSATAPTLIDFNYSGVDEVNFISSGGTLDPAYVPYGLGTQFAMDDLTINGNTAPDAGTTSLMLGATLASLGLLRKKLA